MNMHSPSARRNLAAISNHLQVYVFTFQTRRAEGGLMDIILILILFATAGIAALQILGTASTTGLNSTVAFLSITVVSIFGVLAVVVRLYKKAGAGGL